ncbi:response regulator [Haloflavibacter putidus]|uniref:Response regulator transcription factor n=1 Tax=Haloflavibacter putidus TaxID=2576776 RepID=A0A507ZR69_9FLAO|nr:response regulator [Haloflavibacter putidus]TQD39023.1 response regulator transcription factor [Haloflavibacter putidus]
MFKKVLVAEDIKMINEGVKIALTDFGITHIDFVQYCDDAFLKLKKANLENQAFDLLITDLNFKKDFRKQNLKNGTDLLRAIQKEDFSIKTIAFSIEDRTEKVKQLFDSYKIDAYVCKGRQDIQDLKKAITQVYQNKIYLSPSVDAALNQESLQVQSFDLELLMLVEKGYSHHEISTLLKKRNLKPNSVSAIEKRLNSLKIHFKAKNTINLIAKAKDLGII